MSLLEDLIKHQEDTADRLNKERRAKTLKQLKDWGVNLEGAVEEGPWVTIDGISISVSTDGRFFVSSNKTHMTVENLQGVIDAVEQLGGK